MQCGQVWFGSGSQFCLQVGGTVGSAWIAELLSTQGKEQVEGHWKLIEEFVVASVGHVKEIKKKLKESTDALAAFCGKAMDDAGKMIAAFNELFDVCTSWLGKEIEGDFKRSRGFYRSVQSRFRRSMRSSFRQSTMESGLTS